jgi:hypothetical protein
MGYRNILLSAADELIADVRSARALFAEKRPKIQAGEATLLIARSRIHEMLEELCNAAHPPNCNCALYYGNTCEYDPVLERINTEPVGGSPEDHYGPPNRDAYVTSLVEKLPKNYGARAAVAALIFKSVSSSLGLNLEGAIGVLREHWGRNES